MSIKSIDNEVVLKGRTNNQCWFAPLMTVVPAEDGRDETVLHLHVIQQQGNDLGPMHILRTSDFGGRWSLPAESLRLDKKPLPDDVFESPGLGPLYHHKTKKIIGYGNTVFSRDNSFNSAAKNEVLVYDLLPGRHNVFSVWDDDIGDWDGWQNIVVASHIEQKGIRNILIQPCNQTVELEDGTILMPAVVAVDGCSSNKVVTLRCGFDGNILSVDDIGNYIGSDDPAGRGYHEPSMIRCGNEFFVTIRSDREDFRMYNARSNDGVNWKPIQVWCWDDGTEVETENTQQHFLRQGNDLYLVYTRVNDMSNGVFRNRAPLFIAEVDMDKLCLIRSSEKIVFPAKGGRMGNFAVANMSDNEAWVMVGEWIEQYNPEWKEGMRFYCEIESNGKMYNRNQYIGDMLLAKIMFD